MQDIIEPRKPRGPGWYCRGESPRVMQTGFTAYAWEHLPSNLYAISAVEVANRKIGPEYHVSVSMQTPFGAGRCDRNAAKFVCKAFGMEDAEEDNHVPGGVVRNFWQPVAEGLIGSECPCKATEPAISENKGDYVWRGITE